MQSTVVAAVGIAHAKPARAAELADLLLVLATRSRGEKGCLESRIHTDLADPNVFVFYEMWSTAEDLARHLEQPYMKGFLASRLDYLESDLDVRQLGLAAPAAGPAATNSPADMNQRYLDAYQQRDVDSIMDVYAPGAAAVWEPGKAVSGVEHRGAVAEFLQQEPTLTAEVRESYVAGDIAALIVDWTIEVPGAPEMNGSGRGFDVLRKNEHGQWRYVITNPFGSQ